MSMLRTLRGWRVWPPMLSLLAGCGVMRARPEAPPDMAGDAIRSVAMLACDLVRTQSPTEVESLRSTMSALQLLLRDDQSDWGVISATFDQIPSDSKRYLSLSAALAKESAGDVASYYVGLRHLTTGCLNGLIADPELPGRTWLPPAPPAGSRAARLSAAPLFERHE